MYLDHRYLMGEQMVWWAAVDTGWRSNNVEGGAVSDYRQQQEIDEMGAWLESLWTEICDDCDTDTDDWYNMGDYDE